MLFRTFILAALLIVTFTAHAADITGSVKDDSNRPAGGAQVFIKCPDREKPSEGTTNKYGRYRITGLPNTTWCEIWVFYDSKMSNHARINTGSDSKDINLRLQRSGKNWTLNL